LEAEMIHSGLAAALRDGEVNAGVFDHPLRVIWFVDGRGRGEDRRVETDVRFEVINGYMNMKAFHTLLLWGLRLEVTGVQQPPSAVSMLDKHSSGIPLQQFCVRKVIRAAM
jgi:hypothetical protein